jgi:hypothetical protein
VYEYALGGVVLYVYRPSKSPKLYHLLVRQAGSPLSSASRTDPSHAFGLTRVSRQVHAETRHLPLPLTTFRLRGGGESFNAFLDRLTDAQRTSITTIQISCMEAYRAGCLWDCVEQLRDNSYWAQEYLLKFLEWSHSLAIDRLLGLRHVVVEPAWSAVFYDGVSEHLFRGGVERSIRGRDVEMVLDKTVGKTVSVTP